eukprot:scaffold10600_cov107-Isochrysis_galbana.AAC.2
MACRWRFSRADQCGWHPRTGGIAPPRTTRRPPLPGSSHLCRTGLSQSTPRLNPHALRAQFQVPRAQLRRHPGRDGAGLPPGGGGQRAAGAKCRGARGRRRAHGSLAKRAGGAAVWLPANLAAGQGGGTAHAAPVRLPRRRRGGSRGCSHHDRWRVCRRPRHHARGPLSPAPFVRWAEKKTNHKMPPASSPPHVSLPAPSGLALRSRAVRSARASRPSPQLPAGSPTLPSPVACLSLGRAVELLLTTEGTGFEFVAASAALDFIDETIRGEGWEKED